MIVSLRHRFIFLAVPRIDIRAALRPCLAPGDWEQEGLRQSPKSAMSPDTTQSRFTCVYVDCNYEGHADENAAINIGRRFLERIDVGKSRTATGLDRGAGMNDALRIFPSRSKN